MNQNQLTISITLLLFGSLAQVSAQENASPPGVVKSVNGFAGQVTLSAGPGVKITPAGNGLAIGLQPMSPSNGWLTTGNVIQPGDFLGTLNSAPLELKAAGQRVLRLEPYTNEAPNVIGGSIANNAAPGVFGVVIAGGGAIYDLHNTYSNTVAGHFSSIGGGLANTIQSNAFYSTIIGGYHNTIETNAYGSTLAGGVFNTIQADGVEAVICGGVANYIGYSAAYSTIGGGYNNRISLYGEQSTIGGGRENQILTDALNSTVSGGYRNVVGGANAVVPGGDDNFAFGQNSFAAGHRAQANHDGAFVWADSTDSDIASTAGNQFTARASGGVRIFSDANATVGVQLAAGGNSWAPASDRNLKENFQPANGREILDRVASLPIHTYNMRTQDPSIRHIGPMAQDFQAAFGVGEDDKHIATVDADGVALAAIQGLNEILKEKDREIQDLKNSVRELNMLMSKISEPQVSKSSPAPPSSASHDLDFPEKSD